MIRKILKETMVCIEVYIAIRAYMRAEEKRIKKAEKLVDKFDKYKDYDFEIEEVKKTVDILKRMIQTMKGDMKLFTVRSQ